MLKNIVNGGIRLFKKYCFYSYHHIIYILFHFLHYYDRKTEKKAEGLKTKNEGERAIKHLLRKCSWSQKNKKEGGGKKC